MINYKEETLKKGESWIYSWNVQPQLSRSNTTISSGTPPVWSICSGSSVSISNDSNSATIVQAQLTGLSAGTTYVQVAVTYTNGEIGIYQIKATVEALC